MAKELAEFIVKACHNHDIFFEGIEMPLPRQGAKDWGVVCQADTAVTPGITAVSAELLEKYAEDIPYADFVWLQNIPKEMARLIFESYGLDFLIY